MRYFYTQHFKKFVNIKVWREYEEMKQVPSYTLDGSVMWYNYLGLQFLLKFKMYILNLEGRFCIFRGYVRLTEYQGKYDRFYLCLTLCHPFKCLLLWRVLQSATWMPFRGRSTGSPAGRKGCQRPSG